MARALADVIPEFPSSTNSQRRRPRVVVIGAGFSGLAAAYELALQGIEPIVLEADTEPGGLAASFSAQGRQLERFYHFWYDRDPYLLDLAKELGVEHLVLTRPSPTGMYYAGSMFRLTTPLDVLRFKPLSMVDRVRLAWSIVSARSTKSWEGLDDVTAADWLRRKAGEEVFRVVWEPLLVGKFGHYAYKVSAAWFWAKLVLRSKSRSQGGGEKLMYFEGGFEALVSIMVAEICRRGGEVRLETLATRIEVVDGAVTGVVTPRGRAGCDGVIATTAPEIIAGLLKEGVDRDYVEQLEQIKYLGNICLILELEKSLSSVYWLNVNDPSFPFVAIIEHTNMDPVTEAAPNHVVYLSKYVPVDDPAFSMSDDSLLEFALPYILRMFPDFRREWIKAHHVWRAEYAQPLPLTGYAKRIPEVDAPIAGLKIASMAQIYPADRGTPHAVRDGRIAARKLANELNGSARREHVVA